MLIVLLLSKSLSFWDNSIAELNSGMVGSSKSNISEIEPPNDSTNFHTGEMLLQHSNISPYDYNEYADNISTGDRKSQIFGNVIQEQTNEDTAPHLVSNPDNPPLNIIQSDVQEVQQSLINSNNFNEDRIPDQSLVEFDHSPRGHFEGHIEHTQEHDNGTIPEDDESELAVCTLEKFMCHDGSDCISSLFVCDGDINCQDSSDEFNCTLPQNGEN